MRIHRYARIIELIKENNLIVDSQSYEEVYKKLQTVFNADYSGGAAPSSVIPYNDSLWEQFFTEVTQATGKDLPEELQKKIIQLRVIGREHDEEEKNKSSVPIEWTSHSQETFEKITKEVTEYYLEPYKEEYLKPFMDEYISQYQDLMQRFSQLPDEERENALQELANSLSEDIFSSDKISQTFFNKLQEQGILTEDDRTVISSILQQGDISTITSNDMQKFITEHRENTTDAALVSRILTKKIEDEMLYGKKITELTEDEKQILKCKIQDLNITSENGYAIKIPCYKASDVDIFEIVDAIGQCSPRIEATEEEAQTLLTDRLSETEHFDINVVEGYDTDFIPIQDSETIGQYLSRMEQCVSLISRHIDGENIQFNEYGVQANENAQNLVQSYSNIGITNSDVQTAYETLARTKNEREQNQVQEL